MEKVETFTVHFYDNGGTGSPTLAGFEHLISLKKLEVIADSSKSEIDILEWLNVESARHQNKFEVAVKYN
uniref:Uncharacterized protein n=1 Tax=Oryza glumipatula TaxID=40148 RepID=A0A0D9ZHB2_9ORYZ